MSGSKSFEISDWLTIVIGPSGPFSSAKDLKDEEAVNVQTGNTQSPAGKLSPRKYHASIAVYIGSQQLNFSKLCFSG